MWTLPSASTSNIATRWQWPLPGKADGTGVEGFSRAATAAWEDRQLRSLGNCGMGCAATRTGRGRQKAVLDELEEGGAGECAIEELAVLAWVV